MIGGRPYNAASALDLPTYDGTGQATHPSILRVPGGWNGYEFWMAMTPLAYFNEDLENPSVLASHDGETWVVPNGLTNPIDITGGSYYHSDPSLLIVDGLMYCFYRITSRATNETIPRFKTSSDGVRWSSATPIVTDDWWTSMSIHYHGGQWHCFYVYYITPGSALGGRTIGYRTAPTPEGPWSSVQLATLEGMPASRNVWHLDVYRHMGRWWLVASDAIGSQTGSGGKLLLGTATDPTRWAISEHVLAATGGSAWDGSIIYRPSMYVDGPVARVYYGAASSTNEWRIGLAQPIPLYRWPSPPA